MEENKEVCEALECPVCLSLPSVDNKPLGLPCRHTICHECVRDLVGRASKVDPESWGFECPVCRTNCGVPIDKLEPDMTAIRVMEALKTKKISRSSDTSTPPATEPPNIPPPSKPARTFESGSSAQFSPLEVGGHRKLEPKVQKAAGLKAIAGNWATNPFLNDPSSKPALPPKTRQHPTPERPRRPAPDPPDPPGPPGLPHASSVPAGAGPSQLYVALYDYKPVRPDELVLKKGELYEVTTKCADNWYKGTCKRTLKSGLMPGNFLKLASDSPVPRAPAPLVDLIDLTMSPPQVQSRGRGMFVAIENFPASDKEELDLQVGDEVVMIEQREDGWCRGKVAKTGRVGLFPLNFVRMKKS